MGKPSPPPPPDPVATAQAQTAQNTTTAIANAHLQNVNQVTPWGNQTYRVTGYRTVEDPLSTTTQQTIPYSGVPPQAGGPVTGGPGTNKKTVPGSSQSSSTQGSPLWSQQTEQGGSYRVPTFTATTTLPDHQQQALNYQFATNRNLSETALKRSMFLDNYLNKNIDTRHLTPFNARTPDLYQRDNVSNANQLTRIDTHVGQGPVRSVIDPTKKIKFGTPGAGEGIQSDVQVPDYAPKTYGTGFSQDRQRVEDALMGRMDPYLERNRADLQTQLANQGITPGSEAYDRAMTDLERQENDARMGAILSAGQEQSRLTGLERDRAMFENDVQSREFDRNVTAGGFNNQAQAQAFGQRLQDNAAYNQAQGQEFSQNKLRTDTANQASNQRFAQELAAAQHFNTSYDKIFAREAQNAAMQNSANQAKFNAALAGAQLDNSVRQQQLSERFALRNQPINEIAALMSGSQVQNPNFGVNTPGAIPTTDFAGITNASHAAAMQGYNAQVAQQNSLLGGIGGGLTSILGLF